MILAGADGRFFAFPCGTDATFYQVSKMIGRVKAGVYVIGIEPFRVGMQYPETMVSGSLFGHAVELGERSWGSTILRRDLSGIHPDAELSPGLERIEDLVQAHPIIVGADFRADGSASAIHEGTSIRDLMYAAVEGDHIDLPGVAQVARKMFEDSLGLAVVAFLCFLPTGMAGFKFRGQIFPEDREIDGTDAIAIHFDG